LLGLILVGFVLAFPLRIFAATVEGLQDFKYFGTVNVFVFLFGTAATVVLVLQGFRLYALAFSWIGMQAGTILAFVYRVWTRFPEALPRRLPPMDRQTVKHFFRRGFWVSLNQVAQPLLAGSDLVLVGKLVGPAAVVPYSATGKLSGTLSNQSQILMVSAVPGLSELKTGASKDHIRNVTTALTLSVLVLCGAIVTVVLAINQGFVTRWLGAAQYGGLLLTASFCVAMLMRQWNLITQFVTFCFGHERRITITVFLDGIVTAGTGCLLVWLLGPLGGPLGSIVGVCAIGLPSNLRALSREAKTGIGSLVRPLWPWAWRFSVLGVLSGVLGSLWRPKTFVQIAFEAAMVGLLYCGVMWPVAMRSPVGVYLQRIRRQVSTRLFGTWFMRPVLR
jgi:O-antigen/teichoic acid export membrane protein